MRRIEDAQFPLALEDESDVRCAAVLAAAELIEVLLPPSGVPAGEGSAIITRITPEGRAALSLSRGKSQPVA